MTDAKPATDRHRDGCSLGSPWAERSACDCGLAERLLTDIANKRARVKALEDALTEVDGVLAEYGCDPVGTGSNPGTKELKRVQNIVERATMRNIERVAVSSGGTDAG